MLSSLGAWADLRADCPRRPPGDDSAITQWAHRGTMAREHNVKVVKRGFLFPLGHEASLVQVTERKFQNVQEGKASGQVGAFLRKRAFIIVKQPERDYRLPGSGAFDRHFPFTRVRIGSLVTPDLDLYDGPDAADETKVRYKLF